MTDDLGRESRADNTLLDQALTYARFLRGFPRYLRHTVTLAEAQAAVRHRLDRREENLIATAEKLFFGYEHSPYRPLLELAGCTFAVFRALVCDRGVEAALRELRTAGVYFTFEEYKGRTPVVRHGREIHVEESQFDNPYLAHFFRNSTSGSTGRATPASTGLAHLAVQTELRLVLLDAHDALGLPFCHLAAGAALGQRHEQHPAPGPHGPTGRPVVHATRAGPVHPGAEVTAWPPTPQSSWAGSAAGRSRVPSRSRSTTPSRSLVFWPRQQRATAAPCCRRP